MSRQTSFQADIRPLFTERDILGMMKGFNLANYDDAKAHAAAIYDRIRGIGGAVSSPRQNSLNPPVALLPARDLCSGRYPHPHRSAPA